MSAPATTLMFNPWPRRRKRPAAPATPQSRRALIARRASFLQADLSDDAGSPDRILEEGLPTAFPTYKG